MGLDKLQRHHLRGIERWREEVVWTEVGIALGGLDAVPAVGTSADQRDLTQLSRVAISAVPLDEAH